MKVYFTILRAKNFFYGGPGTFIKILCSWFQLNNFNYEFYPSSKSKNILIISSSRHIFYLIKNKLLGKKIIQRLDGYLWDIHLQKNVQIKIRYFIINFLMNFIRKYLANIVIYQTKSLKKSWNDKYGKIRRCKEFVIYNATLDKIFRNKFKFKNKKFKIICVEGTIQKNDYTFNMIKSLATFAQINSVVESFSLYGKYPLEFKNCLSQFSKTRFEGQKTRDYIMNLYKYEKIIFFCLEQFPSCPNSVIEAIACDTVVVGFDNGSLKEMLEKKSYLINFNNIKKLKNYYYVRNQIFNKLVFCIRNYNFLKKRLFLISKKFRLEIMSKKYLKVFEQ